MSIRAVIKGIPFCQALGRAWNRHRWLRRAWRQRSFAQNGEDQAVLKLFPAHFKGLYVDLGANHPYFISNTYLSYTRGWHGLCVDAIPTLAPLYQRYRPNDTFLNVGVGTQPGDSEFFEMSISELSTFSRAIAEEHTATRRATVVATHRIQTSTVADIVSRLVPDGRFDVLSIDIEGLDVDIVRETDWEFVAPRVVICETSSFEHDWATEVVDALATRGYRHHQHVGCNDIFIATAPGRAPNAIVPD